MNSISGRYRPRTATVNYNADYDSAVFDGLYGKYGTMNDRRSECINRRSAD